MTVPLLSHLPSSQIHEDLRPSQIFTFHDKDSRPSPSFPNFVLSNVAMDCNCNKGCLFPLQLVGLDLKAVIELDRKTGQAGGPLQDLGTLPQ
jgi:hypothetical protein